MKKIVKENLFTKRSDNIDRLFNEMAKFDVLTPDQEYELINKAQKGDEKAKNLVINSNLRFIVTAAKKYTSDPHMLLELISEGSIGLMEALNRFDNTRGFRFISYAVWWINQSIHYYYASKNSMVRIPQNIISLMTRIKNEVNNFEMEYNYAPTQYQLEDLLDADAKDIEFAVVASIKPYSLNNILPDAGDGNFEYMDLITADEFIPFKKEDLQISLDRLLSVLRSDRERYVVRARFGLGMDEKSIAEICEVLELQEQRVRHILKNSLRLIKRHKRLLYDY